MSPPERNGGDAPPSPAPRTESTEQEAHTASVRNPVPAGRAALLAPFIAWMATQPIDEPTRRRYREAVEAWLDWCHTDGEPDAHRRRRFERDLYQHDPDELTAARAGLDKYAEYRGLVARTLPVDPR